MSPRRLALPARTAAVVLLTPAVAGCGLGLSAPAEPVTAERAVGSWRAADCGASLEVARDGAVRFADFPHLKLMSGDDRVRRTSGTGTWRLGENVDGRTTFDFTIGRATRPLPFAVRDDDGELVMLHLVGDPDNWKERCVFTRRGDRPSGDGGGTGQAR